MASQWDSYESSMKYGNDMLKAGKLTDAIIGFQHATAKAQNKHEKASAFQMLTIVHGACDMYAPAKQAAEEALSLAEGDPLFTARIARDAGMALLNIAVKNHSRKLGAPYIRQVIEAGSLLDTSYATLIGSDDKIELAVTLGYLGREGLLTGHSDRGRKQMEEADATLKDGENRTYELNNLMWLIRTVKPHERPALRRRILPLVAKTEQTRRYNELRLIMIGGNSLYQYAERHKWVHRLITRLRGK